MTTVRATRAMPRRAAASALCLALAATPAVAGQQQPPRFGTTVELVQLQVQVADATGAFVPGLSAEDFVVVVDGEERIARSAYEVDLRARSGEAAPAAAGTAPATARRPPAARRHFVLFFDLSYTSRQGILEARRSALEFIDVQSHPDDLIAVATGNRYGIQLLTPFTGDHARARASVETLGLASVTDLISGGSGFEESITRAIREVEGNGRNIGSHSNTEQMLFLTQVGEVGNHVSQLRAFAEMLQGIEGRKHVLFFSRGFDDLVVTGEGLEQMARKSEDRLTEPKLMLYDTPEMTFGNSNVREALGELIETLREADAVVHAIDPTGLRVSSLVDPSRQESEQFAWWASEESHRSTADGHQALMALASGTGGTASWAYNDLTTPLAEIVESTAAYYVVGYRKAPGDPPTVDVEVRVRTTGVRVVSAPSRLTPPPDYADMTPAQRQLQLAELIDDDGERRDIGFAVDVVSYPASADGARAVVAVEVPGPELERLAGERGDDAVQLEIGAFAFADVPGGELRDAFRHRVRVDIGAMRARGSLLGQSFRYAAYVDLPQGRHRVRVLLRESRLGKISGVTRRVSAVAATSSPTVARPLLVSVDNAPAPPGTGAAAWLDPLAMSGRRLSPVADPQVIAGESVLVLLVAYHLPRGADGGLQPGLSFELASEGGRATGIHDFEILGVTDDVATGAVQILVRATVPGSVRSGAAWLRARLTEPTTGDQWQESTSLVVLSGPGGGIPSERQQGQVLTVLDE